MYERANIEIVPELAEGVFLASGAQEAVGECRYGRTEFNKGSDTCQCCSATGGKYASEDQIPDWEMGYKRDANGNVESFRREDATVCPEGKPEK